MCQSHGISRHGFQIGRGEPPNDLQLECVRCKEPYLYSIGGRNKVLFLFSFILSRLLIFKLLVIEIIEQLVEMSKRHSGIPTLP